MTPNKPYKRWVSVFSTAKVSEGNKPSKRAIIESRLRKALREEQMDPTAIDAVIKKIEGVITDTISEYGVDNQVVDSLSTTVKQLNAQDQMIDEISIYESKINKMQRKIKEEVEEAEKEEEAPAEEVAEGEETEADKEEKQLEEKLRRIREMKKRLKEEDEATETEEEEMAEEDETETEETELEEEDETEEPAEELEEEGEEAPETEEEDMEEAINGFRARYSKVSEEAETDEGDLIDDESGSDYDALGIDGEGMASSDLGMEADEDPNAE